MAGLVARQNGSMFQLVKGEYGTDLGHDGRSMREVLSSSVGTVFYREGGCLLF